MKILGKLKMNVLVKISNRPCICMYFNFVYNPLYTGILATNFQQSDTQRKATLIESLCESKKKVENPKSFYSG